MAVKWIRREFPSKDPAGNPMTRVWREARFLTLWGARRELRKLRAFEQNSSGVDNVYFAKWPDGTIFATATIKQALADNKYVLCIEYVDKGGNSVEDIPPRPY
jgi:hypothetical protein